MTTTATGRRDHARLRLVEADLRRPHWVDALDLAGPVDAVVSTTALHWLTARELAAVHAAVAGLVRPGGVFVDGDHQGVGDARLTAVEHAVRDGRAARVHAAAGRVPDEDWAASWQAVGSDPALADHERFLREAGFATTGTVWQQGDDRVLVALR